MQFLTLFHLSSDFWEKELLEFCCDPLRRDLRGLTRVDYLEERRAIPRGLSRVGNTKLLQ